MTNSKTMTDEFEKGINKIENTKVRMMLYDKYKNNVDAAKAAYDTKEILMDVFAKAFAQFDKQEIKLAKLQETNDNIIELLEKYGMAVDEMRKEILDEMRK